MGIRRLLQWVPLKYKMKKILKNRTHEILMIFGIIFILFIVPMISAGFSSDYYSENPATVGPGETKTFDLLRLMSSTNDQNNGSVQYKVEVTDAAGIAKLVGKDEFSVTPTKPALVPVKLTIPSNMTEGRYNVIFKVTDITPSEDVGMIGFVRTSTIVMAILVKKPVEIAPIEKPKANYSWFIIVVALAVIIAIVAYFLLRKKPVKK